MNTLKSIKNLDGRDEFLIALIAGLVPFISLGTLIA